MRRLSSSACKLLVLVASGRQHRHVRKPSSSGDAGRNGSTNASWHMLWPTRWTPLVVAPIIQALLSQDAIELISTQTAQIMHKVLCHKHFFWIESLAQTSVRSCWQSPLRAIHWPDGAAPVNASETLVYSDRAKTSHKKLLCLPSIALRVQRHE